MLEYLEDRSVPSIVFYPGPNATTSDGGGLVMDHAHVYPIFWGNGWNTGSGPALRTNVLNDIDRILSGNYVTSLTQYRSNIAAASRISPVTVTSSNPSTSFTQNDVNAMLWWEFRPGGAVLDPLLHSDLNRLYVVIPQPGSSLTNCGCAGVHADAVYAPPPFFIPAPYRYAVVSNDGSLDRITTLFSHELIESISDPDGTAIQVNPRGVTNWNEIADNDAQHWTYRVNGVLEQSWFSQADHAFIVPTTSR